MLFPILRLLRAVLIARFVVVVVPEKAFPAPERSLPWPAPLLTSQPTFPKHLRLLDVALPLPSVSSSLLFSCVTLAEYYFYLPDGETTAPRSTKQCSSKGGPWQVPVCKLLLVLREMSIKIAI